MQADDKSTSGETMNAATEEAAQSVTDWAQRKSKGRKEGYTTPAMRKRHVKEMEAMMASKDWSAAGARHLVALYGWCHNKVYGLPAPELEDGYQYTRACGAAKRVIDKDFSGSIGATVSFIKWTWQREDWVEKKRKEEGTGGDFRIGWNYQFGPRMVTAYRLDQARRKRI